MIDVFWLITAVLATFGASYAVTKLEGVDGVFDTIRERLGAYEYGVNGQPETRIGRFIGCPFCVGTWIALAIVLVVFPITFRTPVLWMAVTGGHYFICLISKVNQ